MNNPTVHSEDSRILPGVEAVLDQVAELLRLQRVGDAIALITRSALASPWLTNALGVCQLRLGQAEVALGLFRKLATAPGGFGFRRDAPTVFKTNYAAALLASGHLQGGLASLGEVRDEANPAVQRMRADAGRFRSGLSFWQKLNWMLGTPPDLPLPLSGPVGDLR
jgi:hypothetical protein